jgi:hypothetical protein
VTAVAAPRRARRTTLAEQTVEFEKLITEAFAELRTVPAWCARCDQAWQLPIGIGGELCTPCLAAEYADRAAGRRR